MCGSSCSDATESPSAASRTLAKCQVGRSNSRMTTSRRGSIISAQAGATVHRPGSPGPSASCRLRAPGEPSRAETPARIPTWAWVLLLGVVAWAMFYAARQWNPPPEFARSPTYAAWLGAAAQSPPALKAADAGATLYRTSCANCHQSNGQGVPAVFPAPSGHPVVTAPHPTPHIALVLFGLSGKVIGGVTYPGAMPAWGAQLSDAEIAQIVSHERMSWGNSAPTTTPEAVAALRAKGSPRR